MSDTEDTRPAAVMQYWHEKEKTWSSSQSPPTGKCRRSKRLKPTRQESAPVTLSDEPIGAITVVVMEERFTIPVTRATETIGEFTETLTLHLMETVSSKLKSTHKYALYYCGSQLDPEELAAPFCRLDEPLQYQLRPETKTHKKKRKKNQHQRNMSVEGGSYSESAPRSAPSSAVTLPPSSPSPELRGRESPLNRSSTILNLKTISEELQKIGRSSDRKNARNIEIIDEIGTGATAKVYSCYVDGWICAMKELEVDWELEEQLKDGKTREIEILETVVPHPNVVTYHFYHRDGNKLQIFMKLFQTSLDKIIEKRAATDPPTLFKPLEIVSILLDVARGLLHLHKNKVFHRDIKSHNVFLQVQRGRIGTAALGDLDSGKLVTKRSRACSIIGTPSFMAPEVLSSENRTEYTEKVDVFSFGMLFFELLALRLPFLELRRTQVNEFVLSGAVPEMPSFVTEEYDVLVKLHRECINPNPEFRPFTNNLVDRLEVLLTIFQDKV